ncbi:DUF134 domain-containing protein [archaeon]|nr:DUF134 domain-containing protein [archaeon]
MVRPRKNRIVESEPKVTYFKPQAVPLSQLQEVILTVDELETIRLSDLTGMNQTHSAHRMGFHQSTFQRTLASARQKISDAIVNGKSIKIQGGAYIMPGGDTTGPAEAGGRGMGRGRKAGFGGASAICKCPACGHEQPHMRGQPCIELKCPKCKAQMIRG